jgi:hypothetical protein
MQEDKFKSSGPWWKYGHVWMVVGGPAAVVMACFFTIYLAVTRPDPLVNQDRYLRSMEANQTMDPKAAAASLAPAGQARNHAATGVAPPTADPVK